jgi:hypothetical protein
MLIVKTFEVNGWIPAGVVLNAKLRRSSGDNATAYPKLSNQQRILAFNQQATEDTAIRLRGDILSPAIVAPLSSGDNMSSLLPSQVVNSPSLLVTPICFKGSVDLISGDDIPYTRLPLDATQGWVSDEYELKALHAYAIVPESTIKKVSSADSADSFVSSFTSWLKREDAVVIEPEKEGDPTFMWKRISTAQLPLCDWPTVNARQEPGSSTKTVTGPVFIKPGSPKPLMGLVELYTPVSAKYMWAVQQYSDGQKRYVTQMWEPAQLSRSLLVSAVALEGTDMITSI